MNFIDIKGDESEVEFLKKCIQYWKEVIDNRHSNTIKLLQVATIIQEMQLRINKRKGKD
jgi:hypothetical protein